MAHGGHHSSSHHHYYRGYSSRGYYNDGSNMPLIIAGIALIVLFIMTQMTDTIEKKQPIEQSFEVQQYVHDEGGYFTDVDKLEEGLKYLYDKTNVQVVVMTTGELYSDSKAVETYNEMFSDEGHVLIIVPTLWLSSTTYYAIGDIADTVIGDKEVNYLLDQIDSTRSGEKWQTYLVKLADKLISN